MSDSQPRPDPGDVTRMLEAATGGDERAATALFPVVYDELRRLARGYMGGERGDHTLQPTALVHEAFLKLVGPGDTAWETRGHFFATAARAMRRILVDHAISRGRHKRGGGRRRVDLDEAATPGPDGAGGLDLVALDEALDLLAARDAEKARIVELRFFGGLSHQEIAGLTGSSERSVRRSWTFARAWLRGELEREDGSS